MFSSVNVHRNFTDTNSTSIGGSIAVPIHLAPSASVASQQLQESLTISRQVLAPTLVPSTAKRYSKRFAVEIPTMSSPKSSWNSTGHTLPARRHPHCTITNVTVTNAISVTKASTHSPTSTCTSTLRRTRRKCLLVREERVVESSALLQASLTTLRASPVALYASTPCREMCGNPQW